MFLLTVDLVVSILFRRRFHGGKEVEQGTVTNVLAWFALETVMYDLSNWVE